MSEERKEQQNPPAEGDSQGEAMRATPEDRIAPEHPDGDTLSSKAPDDAADPEKSAAGGADGAGTARTAAVPPRQSPRGSRAGWPALLVALIALTGTGYLWQELQQTQRAVSDLTRQLDQPLDARIAGATGPLVQQQRELAERLEAQSALLARTEAQQGTLEDNQAAIRDALVELRGRLGDDVDTLAIAETEYLLIIANHRLQLTGDVATAMTALRSADERLRSAADPAFTSVRQAIARELTALRAVPNVDHIGLSGRIAALADAVDRLPLPGIPGRDTGAAVAELDADRGFDLTTREGWWRIAGAMWNDIKGLVTIRRDGEVQRPLAAPEQRFFLRQNMQLKLESAQLALMQRNTEAYRDALTDAALWAERYFVRGAPEVDAFVQEIRTLAAETIDPELPAIGQSLRQLRQAAGREGRS